MIQRRAQTIVPTNSRFAMTGVMVGLWLLLLLPPVSSLTAQAAFEAPAPVLITSIGQSPDAFTLSVLSTRAKIAFNYENIAGPDMLAGNASVILAVGASQKGFGAAGITLDSELARANALIKEAKRLGLTVIVAHIGGTDRRDPVTMKILAEILPAIDALIVYQGGNQDDFFTNAAAQNNIPIVVVEQVLHTTAILEEVFSGMK